MGSKLACCSSGQEVTERPGGKPVSQTTKWVRVPLPTKDASLDKLDYGHAALAATKWTRENPGWEFADNFRKIEVKEVEMQPDEAKAQQKVNE